MLNYKEVVNLYDIQRIIDAMCVFDDVELEQMVIDNEITLVFGDKSYGIFAVDVDWVPATKEYSLSVRAKDFDRMGKVFYKNSHVRGKGMIGLVGDIKYLVTHRKL